MNKNRYLNQIIKISNNKKIIMISQVQIGLERYGQ